MRNLTTLTMILTMTLTLACGERGTVKIDDAMFDGGSEVTGDSGTAVDDTEDTEPFVDTDDTGDFVDDTGFLPDDTDDPMDTGVEDTDDPPLPPLDPRVENILDLIDAIVTVPPAYNSAYIATCAYCHGNGNTPTFLAPFRLSNRIRNMTDVEFIEALVFGVPGTIMEPMGGPTGPNGTAGDNDEYIAFMAAYLMETLAQPIPTPRP